MTLPALPKPGGKVSAAEVEQIEARVAREIMTVEDFDVLQEWRALGAALEAYLRSKGLALPMMGAERRVEARIGQLLGEAQLGANQHLGLSHEITQIERPNDRSDFRVLANALSGTVQLDADEWRQSRRSLVKYVRNLLGKIAEEQRVAAVTKGVIKQGDALDFLNATERHSIDLLLTDPPYSTEIEDIHGFAEAWVSTALATLKTTGRAYIFTGAYPAELHAYIGELMRLTQSAALPGWTLDNPLVWTYRNTIGPSASRRYMLNWQACFHAYGPDAPPLNATKLVEQFAVQDVSAPDGRTGIRWHAWQKPDALAERLIRHGTEPGQTIIDPFCGTGTFIAAAERLGRHSSGCDSSVEMLALCEQRGLKVEYRAGVVDGNAFGDKTRLDEERASTG